MDSHRFLTGSNRNILIWCFSLNDYVYILIYYITFHLRICLEFTSAYQEKDFSGRHDEE